MNTTPSAAPTLFADRRDRVREVLAERQLDALVVCAEKNVYWLTGFTGDSTYLILNKTAGHDLLVSDFRYLIQLQEECVDLEAFIRPSTMLLPEATAQSIEKLKIQKFGIEEHVVTVDLFQMWQERLKGVQAVSTSMILESLRAVKDAAEIASIRAAVGQAERGFQQLMKTWNPEMSEREVAAELESLLRKEGAEGFAFPAIIGSGAHAALPHYRPDSTQLKNSPIVLLDWGARDPGGYVSDLTRTVLISEADEKFKTVYQVVLEAQLAAIGGIGPGVSGKEIDAQARQVIGDAGFGEYFDHGIGHGIGLNVHENPRMSKISDAVLKPGMVVTVEPGIYLPGWGGIRIEDDVLVTENGYEVLSSLPKDWDSVKQF